MKKVCFITSTRADYGLLKWSMKEIQKSSEFTLQIIATGMHLDENFGNTYLEVEKDGFVMSEKVSLGEILDSRESVINQVAIAVKEISKTIMRLQPDLIVILGDRYEMLGAAQAAFFSSIPIIHLHGGEVTEGALDDCIRHCITKLSQFHITSTEVYRKRVIQLGERPESVFNLGAPGLENFIHEKMMTKEELSQSLGFKFLTKNILMTFHPVTAALEKPESINDVLGALVHFPEVGQIITMPNSDVGHDVIVKALQEYADQKDNVLLVKSLGQLRYSSLMNTVDLVVGNSSSGIIEVPFVGTRTLNIGTRQAGRISAESVFHVECSSEKIKNMISKLLSSNYEKKPSFIYGDGKFSMKFMEVLNGLKINKKAKSFFDLSNQNSEIIK
jgi:UDP-hydrolysing UDP-N-acetyl-D-glucosamine 2-epimerase